MLRLKENFDMLTRWQHKVRDRLRHPTLPIGDFPHYQIVCTSFKSVEIQIQQFLYITVHERLVCMFL